MKKEIVITIIIILVIIMGDIITNNYTKKCVKATNDNLEELKNMVLSKTETNNDLELRAEEIYDEWRNNTKGLAYYIEHNEMEKVDVQMQIITADLEAESMEESIPEIEQAIYLLHHIEEKRALKMKNVF